MYKAILFDLDHTLLDYDRSEQEAMQKAVDLHGLLRERGVDWETFRTVFAPVNWTYWSERFERKLNIAGVLEYSFRDTLALLGLDPGSASDVANTYWRLFCESGHVLEGAKELLAILHGRYKLGVISNGIGEAQRSRLKTGGLDHYFDHLLISDEVGYAKPQPEIFAAALESLGTPRSETLFVGDSLQDDYFGAAGAGIDFCFVNPKGVELQPHIRPAYTIGRLDELESIVKAGQRRV